MAVLYITSDRPGAGKTALAGGLAALFSQRGIRVGYCKPFSPTPQGDPDVEFISRVVLSEEDNAAQLVPLQMPKDAGEGVPLPQDVARELATSIRGLATSKDLVLVEGPSLSSPGGDASHLSTELAEALDASVLVTMQYGPEITVELVRKASEMFGQRLLGVLINSVTRYRDREVRQVLAPAVESLGVKFLGALPEDRTMLAATVGQIAGQLGGDWVLYQEKSEELVEDFLIGGNIMDQGITYFGRMDNKAVIVRGDRPDIQLAALSTPVTCLILTGGHQPIQYVYHQAEQQEVPTFVVQSDTISTAHALDAMIRTSTCHHPRKLQRFQELVSTNVELSRIAAGSNAGSDQGTQR